MGSVVSALSRTFAVLGGVVLTLLIVTTCLSVVGRAINSVLHGDAIQSVAPGVADALLAMGVGPIRGDFEIVQAGMAFAIFAFLPLCQLSDAHASVDLFTSRLPARFNRVLRLVIDVVFALVLILIAVQLFGGTLSKFKSGQTSFLLQYPVWWGYAASLCGAVVAAFVSVYVAVTRFFEMTAGRDLLPSAKEAAQ